MKTLSKFVFIALLNLSFQNSIFAGGAEGHGGGDADVANWYLKTLSARSELRHLVQFPQDYQWTKVSKESVPLFKVYQYELKSVLEKSRIFPMGSIYRHLFHDDCLTLSYPIFLEFDAYRCSRLEYSKDDLLRKLTSLLLQEIGMPEEEGNAFAKDLETLIRIKRAELDPEKA